VSKFYLASPFFNAEQLATVQAIEETFREANVDFFSPRLLDENKEGPINDAAAASIFRKDVHGIITCNAILANLDWKLPEGQAVALIKENMEAHTGTAFAKLNIPDSGTVFEMGAGFMRTYLATQFRHTAAFDPAAICRNCAEYLPGKWQGQLLEVADVLDTLAGLLKPMRTVIYTERPADSNLNLMLTQGAHGVVRGLDELRAFLGKNGSPRWDDLKPWTGKHR
jgi:nucleoside 2-deoxyribosyltransferase